MKKGLLKIGLGAGLILSSYFGIAQPAVQPASFGFINGQTISNWYQDYVGTRFIITRPANIAGEKLHIAAPAASVAGSTWGILGTPPNVPIIDSQIIEGAADSTACAGLDNGTSPYPSMAGKVALIYRNTGTPTACEFGWKALKAQQKGAIACIIVNNLNNGVVGMAGGTYGSGVTIPVYMISETDGNAIVNALHAGDTVRITITPWGHGATNDLGFVFNGGSVWHDYAIPNYELNSSNGNPSAYKQVDGAYVANFGSTTQQNVKLSSTLSFTPNGSTTATVQHSDTTRIDSFPTHDSIVVMYNTANVYDVHNGGNGKGRYDITYNVTSSSTDNFPNDNTSTYSFYTTDSVYSKGKYDFTNGVPYSATYINGLTGNPDIMAGPMYYISSGGHYAAKTQFSVIQIPSGGIPGGLLPNGQAFPIYLFKWVDSPTTFYNDSLVEASELQQGTSLVGVANYTFGGTDSSWETFTVPFVQWGSSSNLLPSLDANSWYWVAADIPSSYAIGYDGFTNYYPRTYGVYKYMHNKESWGLIDSGGYNYLLGAPEAPNDLFDPFIFGGSYSVDSVYFSSEQQGLTPSIPLITTAYQNTGVKNVSNENLKIDVYPNPATDYVNVTVNLPHVANTIYYNVINAVGKRVTSQTHNNLQNDKFTLDTHNLAPGHYYVTVIADKSMITRQFTVLKH